MHILVIDENPSAVDFFRDVLSSRGITVTSASDAVEGIEMADCSPPDAVLCDLQLSSGGAREVIRALQAKSPQMPIVVATEYGEVAEAADAMREGAFGYFIKGSPAEALNRELMGAVAQKRLHDRNQRLERELLRLTLRSTARLRLVA